MNKAVIFDMDGTLQDSSGVIVGAINSVRQKLGLNPMNTEDILKGINNPNINPAKYFYETNSFLPKHEEWFSSYYHDNYATGIRLYEGIKELLIWLKSSGCYLAVATNGYRSSAQSSLKYLGIYEYFDTIVSYDDVANGKPAPDMLFEILHRLNITNKQAVFVGDSELDKLAAQNANIEFIYVSWGYSDANGVGTISQLKRLLKSWCNI